LRDMSVVQGAAHIGRHKRELSGMHGFKKRKDWREKNSREATGNQFEPTGPGHPTVEKKNFQGAKGGRGDVAGH